MASVVPSSSTPPPFPPIERRPPPTGWGGASEKHRVAEARILIVVAVVVICVMATFLLVLYDLNPYGTGPNAFAPDSGPGRVPAGSVGCRDLPANVCYSVSIITLYAGVPFSNLFFAVSNASSPGPGTSVSNNVPLGPGASVSILNSTMSVLGVWNCSARQWSSPPSGVLPYNIPVTIVLDTRLDSNATLAGSYFYVEHSIPSQGAVGFPIGGW